MTASIFRRKRSESLKNKTRRSTPLSQSDDVGHLVEFLPRNYPNPSQFAVRLQGDKASSIFFLSPEKMPSLKVCAPQIRDLVRVRGCSARTHARTDR